MAAEIATTYEVYMTTMTPAEWSAVPDNPRQRDTERRAMQAKHLYTLEASHLLVHMAEWPGGRCKIEGHTRAKVWSDRPEIAPELIDVRVYVVSDQDDAKRLYGHFNSPEESETSRDRLFGAMRESEIDPASTLVRTAKFSNAVRTAYSYMCGNLLKGSVYPAVQEFRNEIRCLDAMDLNKHKAYGTVICCYFMAHRKHGDMIDEFFVRYAQDGGVKDGRSRDCVQMFSDAMEAFRLAGGGFEPFNEACRVGLACIDRWVKSPRAMLSRAPKCDPFRYLD